MKVIKIKTGISHLISHFHPSNIQLLNNYKLKINPNKKVIIKILMKIKNIIKILTKNYHQEDQITAVKAQNLIQIKKNLLINFHPKIKGKIKTASENHKKFVNHHIRLKPTTFNHAQYHLRIVKISNNL